MIKILSDFKRGFLLLFLLIFVFSCSSDNEDSDSFQPPSANLTGTWDIKNTLTGNCPGKTYPYTENESAVITHSTNANEFSIAYSSKSMVITGIISANKVSWDGSFTDSGETEIIDFSGTVSSDGNTITGSANWSWTNGSSSCSGNAEITSIKQQTPQDMGGEWKGTWVSSTGGLSGDFTASIYQVNSDLSGTINIPDIGFYDSSLKGTVNGSQITFGDIFDTIIFTGKLSDSDTASGTYDYPGADSGTWTGTRSPTAPTPDFLEIVLPIAIDASDDCYLAGLTYKNNTFWMVDGNYNSVYNVDMSGDIIDTFDLPGAGFRGITNDGTFLWLTNISMERVYQLDVSGNEISSFESPGPYPRGIAFDGEFFWIADYSEGIIYKLDTSGDIDVSFDSPGPNPTGLTFDGTHLWVAVDEPFGDDIIFQLDLSGDVVAEYDVPISDITDLDFDGSNLWASDGIAAVIYQLEEP